MEKIGIIGGGAWGTALAAVAQKAGCDVILWAREKETVASINNDHENKQFLPNIKLNTEIHATSEITEAANADAVFLVTPAQHLRATCKQLAPVWKKNTPAVICAKGIELKSGSLMSEVVAQELPDATVVILSGPTFAKETALGVPTAVTLACKNKKLGEELANSIGTVNFRPYLSDDIIGSQVGGAVKNVMAIARGIAEGKKFGDNACAALITRGLAEVVRLAVVMGGKHQTLMGLSGIGDLMLTANSMQSRNFSLGVALGQGKTLEEIISSRDSVTEGVATASAVVDAAVKYNIDMPICMAVDKILNHNADIETTIKELLSRPFRSELDNSNL